MREHTPGLTPELEAHCAGRQIWRTPAFPIHRFRPLVEHTARLAYRNPDVLLFFRGQHEDFQSKAESSTLYPAIYRGDALPARELRHRFDVLEEASRLLVQEFKGAKIDGYNELWRKRYMQWSILQHYEVAPTPLLDVTQSLRVACSFAQLNNTNPSCYIYVLGLPYLTNRISINSEHDIVNIRLLSICPPKALRPYFQEGFLTGTSDVTVEFESKTELDFRNRLIAKFEIPRTRAFWGTGFDAIPSTALFPSGDRILDLCNSLKQETRTELQPGDLGDFVSEWVALEQALLEHARRLTSRNVSVREAIQALARRGKLTAHEAANLDNLRQLRNYVVHQPSKAALEDVKNSFDLIRKLKRNISDLAE
jgi:hypothetical protein